MDAEGLELSDVEGGCRLKVRVKPAARQNTVIGPYGGRLKMTVTAAPAKGKANEAVERLLAAFLNLGTSRVRVIAGFSTQEKTVLLEGCSASEVRRRVERMPRLSTGP